MKDKLKRIFGKPVPLWLWVLSLALIGAPAAYAASASITQGTFQFLPYSSGNPATTKVFTANDNATTNGMYSNVPSGSTNGYQWDVAGSPIAQLTAGGVFTPTNYAISGGSTNAFVCTNGSGYLRTGCSGSVLATSAGGTGTSSPGFSCGSGISCGGSFGNPTIALTNYSSYCVSSCGGSGTNEGYYCLATGICINWGVASASAGSQSSVTFAHTYSVAALNVTAVANQYGCGATGIGIVVVTSISTGGFNYGVAGCSGGTNVTFYFQAIGYN